MGYGQSWFHDDDCPAENGYYYDSDDGKWFESNKDRLDYISGRSDKSIPSLKLKEYNNCFNSYYPDGTIVTHYND